MATKPKPKAASPARKAAEERTDVQPLPPAPDTKVEPASVRKDVLDDPKVERADAADPAVQPTADTPVEAASPAPAPDMPPALYNTPSDPPEPPAPAPAPAVDEKPTDPLSAVLGAIQGIGETINALSQRMDRVERGQVPLQLADQNQFGGAGDVNPRISDADMAKRMALHAGQLQHPPKRQLRVGGAWQKPVGSKGYSVVVPVGNRRIEVRREVPIPPSNEQE